MGASDIHLFCTDAIVRTGMWGERLELQRAGEAELTPVPVPEWLGVWEHFIAIRKGQMANASPPEVGLVQLYDAIRASAAQNGVPVTLSAK